ncbi:hypothetical protein JDV02_007299 [Purpureocillium takamizusanense]|uniref:DUF7703 domain-containing protein n=1 Tax=Purpureocillium takamizusanense TaxID=2060973 RepID=A0A9Q8QK11_9HYPO|nr:uncharacterized protein JDV02_007299 [Purpureocillium takamizusanense]UNI21298.1 hypothetical protein JDV02_007299 [Purpureocillium takamizusanense]
MVDTSDDESTLGLPGHRSGDWLTIIVFISIALYNVVELNFLIASTFKRYTGLYFWSFLVATWGVAFNAVGYLVRSLRADPSGYAQATIILIGWCTMVTGQSLVLYSRLHIVLHSATRLRMVLIMIIANAIWLGVPVIVLVYGTNSNNPEPFEKPYSIFEKLQLTVFCVQEVVISCLYIFETAKLLKLHRGVANSGTRRVMGHLILVNVFIVLLDISILILEFTEHYNLQTAWKALVYSVKLKAEFTVLNRLVEFSQLLLRNASSLNPSRPRNTTDIALERYVLNASRAPTETEYEVHVGTGRRDSEKENAQPQGLEVVKTTAVTVSRSERQPGDGCSSAGQASAEEDITEAGCASSVSSEAHLAKP